MGVALQRHMQKVLLNKQNKTPKPKTLQNIISKIHKTLFIFILDGIIHNGHYVRSTSLWLDLGINSCHIGHPFPVVACAVTLLCVMQGVPS